MKKNIISACLSVFIVSALALSVSPIANAQTATSTIIDTNLSAVASSTPVIIAPLTGTTTSPDIEPGQTKPATTATSTGGTVQVNPTTTPTYPTGELKNGDPINKKIEDVLNTTIAPKAEPKKATSTPASTKKATSTPVVGSTKSDTTPTTPEPKTTAPTSEDASPVTAIVGDSNGFTPTEYYIPLDNLSPETTYTLSFIAMILGIIGAVLILKEPAPAPIWVRGGLKTQESLLE